MEEDWIWMVMEKWVMHKQDMEMTNAKVT